MKNYIDLILAIICLLLIIYLPDLGLIISFFAVLLYLLIGKDRKQKLNSVGFKKPTSWLKVILTGLVLGIIIELSFQIFINPFFELLTNNKIDLSAYDSVIGNIPTFLIMLAVGIIIGGLFEEILFRGFLLTRIAKLFNNSKLGIIIAVIATSAIFGLSHIYQGWSGVLNTGSIAVIFAIIFLYFDKNLWYSIFTHAFINVVGFSVIYLDLSEKLRTLVF